MAPSEQEIRDVAKRAAEVLRRDGWQPRPAQSDRGPCCLLNALGRVPEYAERMAAGDRAMLRARILRLTGCSGWGDSHMMLASWNDDIARPGDAISILERVASGEGAP